MFFSLSLSEAGSSKFVFSSDDEDDEEDAARGSGKGGKGKAVISDDNDEEDFAPDHSLEKDSEMDSPAPPPM